MSIKKCLYSSGILALEFFLARSISEEFSSGDAGRYRDSEEYSQSHTPGRDSRQDKTNKDKEDRDEGRSIKSKIVNF